MRRSSDPMVSVMMPMYNAAEHVGMCVASLLAQTHQNWELIVIDDGSTDNGAAVVEAVGDSRIRLIRGRKNRGLPYRLNQAVRLSRGAFLARMDADDIAFPDRLRVQLAYLLAHPLVDVVATNMLVIDGDGNPDGHERWRGSRHHDVVRRPWSGFHFNHATWLGRAAWFRRFPYNEKAVRTEDDELLLRAFRTSRFYRLPDVLYAYRVEGFSSRAVWTARRHFAQMLWRQGLKQRDPRLLLGVVGQVVKAVAERGAEAAGLSSMVRQHRSGGDIPAEVESSYKSLLAALSTAT